VTGGQGRNLFAMRVVEWLRYGQEPAVRLAAERGDRVIEDFCRVNGAIDQRDVLSGGGLCRLDDGQRVGSRLGII
jgi:hypothetical protein